MKQLEVYWLVGSLSEFMVVSSTWAKTALQHYLLISVIYRRGILCKGH